MGLVQMLSCAVEADRQAAERSVLAGIATGAAEREAETQGELAAVKRRLSHALGAT